MARNDDKGSESQDSSTWGKDEWEEWLESRK